LAATAAAQPLRPAQPDADRGASGRLNPAEGGKQNLFFTNEFRVAAATDCQCLVEEKEPMSSAYTEDESLEIGDDLYGANAETPDELLRDVARAWAGPKCEKCGAPMKADGVTICRRCGWYASLGTFVEIDRNWDKLDDEHAADENEQQAPKKVGLEAVPAWAWVLLGTLSGIVAVSVAVRLATPTGSDIRTYWSLGQLGLGLLAFIGCHGFNFLVAASEDADLSLMDMFTKPLNLWIRAAGNLPHHLWVVNTAASGFTASVMSVAVIGGIPYDALWHTDKPKKQNILAAAVQQATQLHGSGDDSSLAETVGDVGEEEGNGSKSLDDAVGKVGGGGGAAGKATNSEMPPPEPRPTINCVILGFRLDEQGKISVLILAAAYKGKLTYAGFVEPPENNEDTAKLAEQLPQTKTDQPYLPLYTKAIWVKPRFSCEISFQKRDHDGRLIDAKWEKLVGAL
jgi:ATP dependent DNA ligase-like protein